MVDYSKTAWTGALERQNTTTADARAARAASPSAGITLHEAIEEFLEAAQRGSTLDRYGRAFDADAVRELRWCLSGHVDDRLGTMALAQVSRHDLEALVDDLGAAGLSRRRLRAVAKSLRALYDYAAERGTADHNPAERIALPDEDDAEQPSRGRPQPRPRAQRSLGGEAARMLAGAARLRAEGERMGADRALSVGLQIATLCFVLVALFFIAESL
jgi:hypothetical protein